MDFRRNILKYLNIIINKTIKYIMKKRISPVIFKIFNF